MISEKEYKNYKEIIFLEEPEEKNKEIKVEMIYKIIELEKIYDVFPNYDLQDDILTQNILEVYKMLFWGISALVSTLLWYYFLIN